MGPITYETLTLGEDNNLPTPGRYFLSGNEACAEAAIAVGCRFFAGYPITPSSDIMEQMSRRLPEVGGTFMQMEDEIASIACVIGASWAGSKAMTATSGPGISLMLENIGYAVMTQTPCVIVDVQRAGPSTGQATRPAQGDVMQVRWGSHGDYRIIALCPESVGEIWTHTILAFNLSEEFRIPVFIMSDASLAHLKESCVIPKTISIARMPDRPSFGTGKKILLTGSTHDENGFRKTTDPKAQQKLVEGLYSKLDNAPHLERVEQLQLEDAEIMIFAYGCVARAAKEAVKKLREMGIKAGLFRPEIIWPFPGARLASQKNPHLKLILVPEMNMGQMIREVRAHVNIPAVPFNITNGEVITPTQIVKAAMSYL